MSVVADFQVNGVSPSVVGGLGTTVKYFPRLLGPSIGVAPSTPSATNAAGQLVIPVGGTLNGQAFRVIAAGNFFSNNNGTVTVALSVNKGTVASPTYVEIASTSAVAASASTESFAIIADLVADNVSLSLGGLQTVIVQGALNNTTPKTSDNSPVAIPAGSLITGQLGLVVGVTFSVSDAAHTASLYQFQIES